MNNGPRETDTFYAWLILALVGFGLLLRYYPLIEAALNQVWLVFLAGALIFVLFAGVQHWLTERRARRPRE